MSRYLNIGLIVLTAGLILTGCSSTNQSIVARTSFVDDHPELSEMQADAILNSQIMVGMTDEMVRASWGDPARIEAVTDEEASIHWIYGNHFVGGNITNLYFDEEETLIRYEVNHQPTHANSGGPGGTSEDVVAKATNNGTNALLSKDGGRN